LPEALQRVVGAFPAEIQNNVAAQLADCLIGVVSQRLQFRPGLNICVPECEVLMSTLPIKNFIRNRDFFKIVNSVENRGRAWHVTFQRYRAWLDKRANFHVPMRETEPDEEEAAAPAKSTPRLPATPPPSARPAAAAHILQPERTEAGGLKSRRPKSSRRSSRHRRDRRVQKTELCTRALRPQN